MLKIITILTLTLTFSWFASGTAIIGIAKSKSGMTYTETHKISYSDINKNDILEINTDYKVGSKPIGFRQQVFSQLHYVPNTVFKDLRHNDTYSITVNGKLGVLKTYFNGVEKTLEFNITKNQVTTASLAKYIYQNFETLLKEPQTVNCLIPKSLLFVKLKIKKKSSDSKNVTFVVEPSSLVLRWLASKTYITFNLKTKEWVKYVGITNLKDLDGQSPNVKILYSAKN